MFIGYQLMARTTPSGSITKVARTVALSLEPASTMPKAWPMAMEGSSMIGNGTFTPKRR
jgi:hypothetical protein